MQLEFFDVPSPCVGICQSDSKGYCLGCFRTREERQSWTSLDLLNKKKVIKRCQQRKRRKDTQAKNKVEDKDIPIVDDFVQQPSLFDPPQKKITTQPSVLDFGDFEL